MSNDGQGQESLVTDIKDTYKKKSPCLQYVSVLYEVTIAYSPLTHDVGWSRRSSSHSVQSEAGSENTSPTSSPIDRLLKGSE